jgi:predicted RND superfamily exporter protein
MKGIRFIIIILLLMIIIFLVGMKKTTLIYVQSDIDDKMYLVRDLGDKQRAANMLSRLKVNIYKIRDHLVKNIGKYPNMEPHIKQLNRKLKHTEYNESTEDSVYTSYSVNKGEQIVFCLRSKEYKNELHSLNLVMYVTLHEMAHVACPEFGHTALFKEIFAFFAKIAIEMGIYKRIPFNKYRQEYCGLYIENSII